MIRVYFDSDVINKIRSGELSRLAESVNSNRSKLLIPFSHAHVSDKLPSKEKNQELFWRDIDFLTDFSQSKYIAFDMKKEYSAPYITDARAVLASLEENNQLIEEFSNVDNITRFLKETAAELDVPEMGKLFETILDLPIELGEVETFGEKLQKGADYIHSMRKDASVYKANREEIKKEYALPSDSGNWKVDVLDKIDEHIKSWGLHENFFDMVESSFKDKDKIDRFSYYVQSYTLLNIVGYRADEIKPKNNKGLVNHLQDAIHSFYGGHCDFFVVMDKRMADKTRVLYEHFNISTKIVTPEEFSGILNTALEQRSFKETIDQIISMAPVDTLIEDGFIKNLYRLENYWLGYFTHLQYEFSETTNQRILLFTKSSINYSNFMYYEEHDKVIESIDNFFGDGTMTESIKNKFRSADKDDHFHEYLLSDFYVRFTTDNRSFYLWIVQYLNQNERNI